jgi:chromosome segregation ATPase
MAVVTRGEYEELEAEYKASQQQLASKDQALKIFQEQLKNSEFNSQRLQQEINQLRSQLTRVQLPHQNGGEEERGVAQSISEEVVKEKERYLQELEAAQVSFI